MKRLFVTLSMMLAACVLSPEDEVVEVSDVDSETEWSEWQNNHSEMSECLATAFYTFIEIDSQSYLVRIPNLCNPNPEIYTGMPGEEMIPFNMEDDLETYNLIMEHLNVKLVVAGSQYFIANSQE